MKRGSLGPTIVMSRGGRHGRRRGKRLSLAQVSERVRSRRQLQSALLSQHSEQVRGLLSMCNPISPNGKVIR